MKQSLLSRLERLEARTVASIPPVFRYGWLTPLPEGNTGERHVVIVVRTPTDSPNIEWCEFAERAGPAPPGFDDGSLTVYLTRD